jgi:Na+-translocating ferredoxin:NAD+ oxidoreductase RnfG subunit
VVTGYDGNVWVENGEDGGAVFTVELHKDGGWQDVTSGGTTSSRAATQGE